MVCTATWSPADIHGPCFCRKTWCEWPVLLPESMLMSWVVRLLRATMVSTACATAEGRISVCTTTRDHAEVPDTCWHQTMPMSMCKPMIHVPAYCKGKESYFCRCNDDCRLTVEKKRTYTSSVTTLTLPLHRTPQKSNSLGRKTPKRTLKVVLGMLWWRSRQLITSSRVLVGKELSLRGWALRACSCSSEYMEYMGNTNWSCLFFFLFMKGCLSHE